MAERLEAEGAEERRRLKSAVKAVLLALGAVALAVFAWQAVPALWHLAVYYRPVPDIARAGLAGAAKAGERAGWRAEEVAVFEGDPGELPLGVLVRQEPGSGTWGWRDQSIRLMVRKGSARVTMPEVRGLAVGAANERLVKAGAGRIEAPEKYDKDPDYHHLVVVSTEPSAGGLIERGRSPKPTLRVDAQAAGTFRHWEVVKALGSADCFRCHHEPQCSECHVKSAGPAIPSAPSHPVTGPVGPYLLERAAEAIERWPAGAGTTPKAFGESPRRPSEPSLGLLADASADRTALLRIARWVLGVALTERDDVSALTLDVYLGGTAPSDRALSLTLTKKTASAIHWQDVPAESLPKAVDNVDRTPLWAR